MRDREIIQENRVERQIMWGDLDSLGIVFYPRYFEWMDGCGHLFFERLGIDMGGLLRQRGLAFGLIETSCTYHVPGRYHDRLEIRTFLKRLAAKWLLLVHEIRRKSDEKLLAVGRERRVCMDVRDPKRFRAVAIPDDLKSILQKAAEGEFVDDPDNVGIQ